MISSLLPSSSFVPFRARRILGAEVVWRNEGLGAIRLDDYAYAMRLDHEADKEYGSEEKTLLGERYGGKGLVNNGGGVRCGLIGGLQVKGIGRNPLVGNNPNYWYSHGAATLEEGIREAVWGEVLSLALPYGGVRTHAVIATRTQAPFEGAVGTEYVPRALIIREAVLRPGHYMRAPYYQPTDLMAQNYPSDVERTKAAIQAIDKGFETILGYPARARFDTDYLNSGLLEMTRRFAAQLAAARAKRITHGSLGCSNIGSAGRWLDYGTITAISDYGRIIVARGHPDIWGEQTELFPTLRNFVYYLHKYLPAGSTTGLLVPDDLMMHYVRQLNERQSIEFLKLTGIPERRLAALEPPVLEQMFNAMMQVARRGNHEPFKLDQMPDKMGRYHLNSILQQISLCDSPEQAERRLKEWLDDAVLRKRFIGAYFDLRSRCVAAEATSGKQPGTFKLYVSIEAHRRNNALSSLYRPNLVRTINAIIGDRPAPELIRDTIASIVNEVRLSLTEPGREGAFIAIDRSGRKVFLQEGGAAFVKDASTTERLALWDFLRSDACGALLGPNRKMMLDYATELFESL